MVKMGINLDSESVLKGLTTSKGIQKFKALLKDDKDEAHTYWALVLLSLLCGTRPMN